MSPTEPRGLRPGRLFRSSELSRLDDDGRATLRRLGITDVADLRATREVARRGPGLVPDGIDVHLLPFPDLGDHDESDGEAPHEHAFRQMLSGEGFDRRTRRVRRIPAEAAARYMTDEYRQFPTRNGAQRALHRVFTLLGAGRPVLTHCFAGKDRTGFVIATVLETIGIDRDVIVADYLRSNDSVAQLRERITEMLQQRSDTEADPGGGEVHRGTAVRRGTRGPRRVPGRGAANDRRDVRVAGGLPARRRHHCGRRRPTARRAARLNPPLRSGFGAFA